MSMQSRRKFLKIVSASAIAAAAAVAGAGVYFDLFRNTGTSNSSGSSTNTGTSSNFISEPSTTILDEADYNFFIAPYKDQINRVVDWLMQPWEGSTGTSSSHSYGFDSNFQLVRGGNWPGYTDTSGNVYKNGYHPGMVIIDNNFQHGLSLDWFNAQPYAE